MPLFIAPKNETLKVLRVTGDEKVKNHLASLGIVEESTLTVLSAQASGVIVKVKESRLALDNDIASRILVAC